MTQPRATDVEYPCAQPPLQPLGSNARLPSQTATAMDADDDAETPPRTHIRWFHAGHGVGHLDLLATPVVARAAAGAAHTAWTGFTRAESDRCEAAWHALSDAQRAHALAGDPALPVAAPVLNDDDEVRRVPCVMRTRVTLLIYTYAGRAHPRCPYWERAALRGRCAHAACTSCHLALTCVH